MPRFPLLDQLALPVRFERYVAGKLHPDGRRYLPLLVLALPDGSRIGVVDRHHLVDPELAGHSGSARLVFLLSDVMLQSSPERRAGIVPEYAEGDRVSTTPDVYGRVVAVPTWELRRGALPYDVAYMEVLLHVGVGVVGLRTSVTADNIATRMGTDRLRPDDWVHVARSRVDILGFVPKA